LMFSAYRTLSMPSLGSVVAGTDAGVTCTVGSGRLAHAASIIESGNKRMVFIME
jgi:hypothetical protein